MSKRLWTREAARQVKTHRRASIGLPIPEILFILAYGSGQEQVAKIL